MKSVSALYPRFHKIANDFLTAAAEAQIPVLAFCTRRTLEENAIIYPHSPLRWSNHIAAVAIDVYPAEYLHWPHGEFQHRFDAWPYWNKLREISRACGIDAPQPFNAWDKDHFQCLFGTSGDILKSEFMNFAGTEDQKLQNVWRYLDAHGKAEKNEADA
jgi:hypothetical protein